MASAFTSAEPWPLVLRLGPVARRISRQEFFKLCQANPELRLERTSEGDLIIMPPAGSAAGRANSRVTGQLSAWAVADGTGEDFDSSTGFTLPNGAIRSPDAAWVSRARWKALTVQEREEFAPLCPDFVVEMRSRTDRLKAVQAKMEEYIANGAQLGWLIDPFEKRVHVYRPGETPVTLDHPETVSGEPLLHGFVLDLSAIWD
jgi:Uma2 family endonuclease